MKVTEHLEKRTKTLLSFEILPPLKGENVDVIFEKLKRLLECNPSFIDVTSHREEYVYKKHKNGLLERKSVCKRPGTVGICAAIKNKFNIDTVPHVICGGFSQEETENALIDLNFLGIDNVLLLRGDPMKSETIFKPEEGGNHYASDLVKQVANLNEGIYLDKDIETAKPTNFCIGVAGYPEKHFESPNFDTDLMYLKKKVNLGAEYIVTQMFFDNQVYFNFVEKCRKMGITVPIIPGLKLLKSKKQLMTIPRHFYVNIPNDLVKDITNAKSSLSELEIGQIWLKEQSKELIKFGAPCLHYYTLGRSEDILDIVQKIL